MNRTPAVSGDVNLVAVAESQAPSPGMSHVATTGEEAKTPTVDTAMRRASGARETAAGAGPNPPDPRPLPAQERNTT